MIQSANIAPIEGLQLLAA